MRRVELALTVLALVPSAAAHQDDVDVEWDVRRRALRESGSFRFDDQRWEVRDASLEALARRLDLGLPVEDECEDALFTLLMDESPNVRARATSCLGLLRSSAWSSEDVERLAADPAPEVRAQLCRALPANLWAAQLGVLEALARSDELEVRRAARETLFELGSVRPECPVEDHAADAVRAAQVRVLNWVFSNEGTKSYLREVEQWRRTPRRSAFVFSPDEATAGLQDDSQPVASNPEARSLDAALALWTALCVATPADEDARRLAAGWQIPLDKQWSDKHRLQREWLLEAAPRFGAPLENHLFDALTAEVLLATNRRGRTANLTQRIEDLVEGLVATSGPQRIIERLGDSGGSPETLKEFWGQVASAELEWTPESLAKWAPEHFDREVRVAVVDSLANSYQRTGDVEQARLLTGLFDDPVFEIRDIAFRTLCTGQRTSDAATQSALFEAWSQFPAGVLAEQLAWLPRGVALLPFRETLLELASDADDRRRFVPVLELLGAFREDSEVGEQLERWLVEDARLAAQGNVSGERVARAGVRALVTARQDEAVPALAEVAGIVSGKNVNVAKDTLRALGRSEAGVRVLAEFVREERPSRELIEAGLALYLRGRPNEQGWAEDRLIDRYPNCDSELQSRILTAFRKRPTGPAAEYVAGSLFRDEIRIELRSSAAQVLLARFEASQRKSDFNQFIKLVRHAPDEESLRIALSCLGSTRSPDAVGFLEVQLKREDVGAEREELLIALARCAPRSELLWNEIWKAPLGDAREQTSLRFLGEKAAAVEFSYRGELLAVGELERIATELPDLPGEVERIDPRLALALSDAFSNIGATEHAFHLQRIALVGLAGEAFDVESRFLRGRARIQLWLHAEKLERFGEWAWHAERLRDARLQSELSPRDIEAILGPKIPEEGKDPLARIEASWLQANARANAAQSVEDDCIEHWLTASRELIGTSAAALEAQERAEREQR